MNKDPATIIAEMVASLKKMREALTPSADTKAAYIGEFSFSIPETIEDDDGDMVERYRSVMVPWTTVKEIMAAILTRATKEQAS